VPHAAPPLLVRFLPDGKHMVSGGADLRLWSDDIPGDRAGLLAWIDAHTNEVAPALPR
jgi:hypothetical protein